MEEFQEPLDTASGAPWTAELMSGSMGGEDLKSTMHGSSIAGSDTERGGQENAEVDQPPPPGGEGSRGAWGCLGRQALNPP